MLTPWHNWSALPLVFVFLSACASFAQVVDGTTGDLSGAPTYRSAVSEVRVTFFATGENNHPVESLTKSDFAIVDNERVVRNFRSFTHSDETSLDVVVLVDMSESVASRIRVAVGDVLRIVANEPSIPDDNISVVSFGGMVEQTGGSFRGSTPAILCTSGCRTSDSAAKLLTAKFSTTKSGESTPLFDALIFGADLVSQHRRDRVHDGVRPVLILFSDGYDTISQHSAREALQAVQHAGARVYCVDMGEMATGELENLNSGGGLLRRLSGATGGRYFSLSTRFSQPDAAEVLNAVLEDLRASYLVTYDLPTHEAGFHSLRILPTHNLNLAFHSRNGYEYEPSGQ